MTEQRQVDVVVVGAGFAGLYLLHRLRGLGLTARVFEAGGGVGGTWYWNRYPGARCDVESLEYSYGVRRGPPAGVGVDRALRRPSPRSSRYLEHVADRFDLRRDIRFDTRVRRAPRSTSTTSRWTVAHRRRRRARSAHVRRDGDGMPFVGEHSRLHRARLASRARPTTPVGGRTRASTSPASASA